VRTPATAWTRPHRLRMAFSSGPMPVAAQHRRNSGSKRLRTGTRLRSDPCILLPLQEQIDETVVVPVLRRRPLGPAVKVESRCERRLGASSALRDLEISPIFLRSRALIWPPITHSRRRLTFTTGSQRPAISRSLDGTELLVGHSRQELHVFLGQPGIGLWSRQPQEVAATLPGDERNSWLVDLNQDGKQDLLMHHPSATEPHRLTMLIAR